MLRMTLSEKTEVSEPEVKKKKRKTNAQNICFSKTCYSAGVWLAPSILARRLLREKGKASRGTQVVIPPLLVYGGDPPLLVYEGTPLCLSMEEYTLALCWLQF